MTTASLGDGDDVITAAGPGYGGKKTLRALESRSKGKILSKTIGARFKNNDNTSYDKTLHITGVNTRPSVLLFQDR